MRTEKNRTGGISTRSGLMIFGISVVFSVLFLVMDRCDTARLIPGKGLEETLAAIGTRALFQNGRSERVEKVTDLACRKVSEESGYFGSATFDCSAMAHLTGGRTVKMCITRNFKYNAVSGSRGTSRNLLEIVVDMCGLGKNISASGSYTYVNYGDELTSDVK